MISIFKQYSFRYIKERKVRTATTVFGITLGIVLIIATVIVNRSALASYQKLVSSAAGKTELQVRPLADSGFQKKYLLDVLEVKGVKGAYPLVIGNSLVSKGEKKLDMIMIYAVDERIDQEIRDYDLSKGRFISGEEKEVVLTEQYAKINKFKLGDEVNILTKKSFVPFKIVGLMSDKGAGNTNNGKFAVINMDEGQAIYSRQGRYDQIDLTIKKGFSVEEVKNSLEKKVGQELDIVKPASRSKDIEGSMDSYNFFISLTGAVSFLVGIFIIFNNMEISVEERRFHIAMLRALGLRRKRILALVLFEAGILGALGGLLGIILGYWLAKGMATVVAGLISALFRINITELKLTSDTILIGLIGGPLVSILSTLGPAYRMLQIDPLEALVPMETSWGKRSKMSILFGFISLILGNIILLSFIFVGTSYFEKYSIVQVEAFGVTGIAFLLIGLIIIMPNMVKAVLNKLGSRLVVLRLAIDNLVRTPGRTSATVAGMMIALIMMIMVATLSLSTKRLTRDWIEKAIGWDMLVSSSYQGTKMDVPLDEELGEKLRKMKEVKIANALRFTKTLYKGKTVNLLTFEMETLFEFGKFNIMEGDIDLFEKKMKTGRYVALNASASRKLNLENNETIEFKTPNGPAEFEIAGIVNEAGGDVGAIYMDRPTYKKLWGDSRVDGYDVVLNKGYAVKDVKRKIEKRFGQDYYLAIREHEQFKKEVLSLLDQSFTLANLIVYIALFVAAVGIMNTALISAWQRKREISTIRAIGAKKRQTFYILLNETIVIGFTGTAIGLSIGTFIGKVMVDANASVTGVNLDFYLPWTAIIFGFAVAMILSVLSSVIPGRVAAGTNIIEGLRYE